MCCRQEARLVIGNLELDAGLVERALQGLLGWDKEPEDEQHIAVALGYVAHLVDRLAAYLHVPLRYPIHPGQSISAILEHAPPCGTFRSPSFPLTCCLLHEAGYACIPICTGSASSMGLALFLTPQGASMRQQDCSDSQHI